MNEALPQCTPLEGSAKEAAPALLDETVIGVVALRELDAALAKFPHWVHPFAGLEYNRAKRCYGQAHADGRVILTSQFIGTSALADLEDTLRHEFAHLIVGVRERHGALWKQVARSLGAVPRASGRSRAPDLQTRMNDAPWALIAIMGDGQEIELKRVYRRSRRYQDYELGRRGQRYLVQGRPVVRFSYRAT